MRQLKYGGQIFPGDFIAISDGNHINFGWYAGNGRNTLQYYGFRIPKDAYERYEQWTMLKEEDKKSKWTNKQFEKGFTIKCLWKSFINSVHKTRVIKITNVEDIFTEQEDIKAYQESREVMIKLNLVKQ
jgi:hypothetical protein